MFQRLKDQYLKAGIAAASLVPAFAFAQASDPFDTALATATTKVGGYAAALVGLAAASVVFMIGVKYVKKIKSAS